VGKSVKKYPYDRKAGLPESIEEKKGRMKEDRKDPPKSALH
jgi:hypothetical protein